MTKTASSDSLYGMVCTSEELEGFMNGQKGEKSLRYGGACPNEQWISVYADVKKDPSAYFDAC